MSPADASKEERRRDKRARKELKRKLQAAESGCVDTAPADASSVKKSKKSSAYGSQEDRAAAKAAKKAKKSAGKKSKKAIDAAVDPAVHVKNGAPSKEFEKWFADNEIIVDDSDGKSKWTPLLTFAESRLDDNILHITKAYERPTPIQSTCWPIALAGRDIIGIAETGSGKTMAFGIPALAHIMAKRGGSKTGKGTVNNNNNKPTVLALAPTRELALQIGEQFDKASELCAARSIVVFGGVNKDEQRKRLRSGVDTVIACPGRLLDLVQEGSCDLSHVDYVILDEADRMLDMGFEQAVRDIIGMTLAKRQIVMFSATWPQSIQKLANEFLKMPVKVTVGSPDLGASATITQIVEVLEPHDKESRVLQLLAKYHSSRTNRVLLFALYKKEAARLEQFLQRRGWNCIAIHGDMQQAARNNSFYKFKSGEIPLLIATDVAARGLDIPNVEYVINYTFPLTIEDYVHRIGRTGRAGKTGVAHTLFTAHDKARAGELSNLLKQTSQPVPESLTAFGTTVKKKEHAAYGAFFKDVDTSVKATKITFASDDEDED